MAFFHNLGFQHHPFAQTNADEEPYLSDYFVPPPFFDAVIGNPEHPGASIVLAPRGAGKSALRRKVELWAPSEGVLAVTYDRFEFGVGQQLEDVGLPYHLRNIIVRVLIGYLSFLAEKKDLISSLDRTEKKTLSIFVHSYLGGITGESLQTILKEIKSIPQKIKEFWSNNVGFLESLVNVLLKSYGLEAIDLPDLKTEEKKLEGSYKYQLEIILALARKAGVKSIYVLIDKLDESEKTGTDPDKTYQLIQPLIKDLELLSLTGYGFKVFAWDKILSHFTLDARPDRVHQYKLHWTRKSLEVVLKKRLAAFSDNRINSFSQIEEMPSKQNTDSILCLLANGSPRNLIRICEKIFAVQAELDASATKISPNAIDLGILTYSQEISKQLYGEEVCNDLKRVGRDLFSINYLANDIFKTRHENTSRNKVSAWQNIGVVAQLDGVSVTEARRPINLYVVTDPAMSRVIFEKTPLAEFISDRWLTCSHCQADNLYSISLYPPGNDPICVGCHRVLF